MGNLNKVLFDLCATQSSNESPVHGGGEYAKYVFKASLKYKERLVCFFDVNKKLDDGIVEQCNSNNVELIGIRNNSDISNIIMRKDIDTFYSALPYDYSNIELFDKRFVGTVHGLRSIEFPSDKFEYIYRVGFLNKLRLNVGKLIKNKNRRRDISKEYFSDLFGMRNFEIITDSIHSKYSFMTFFPHLKASNISVFRCPYDFDTKQFEMHKTNDYFLLVSSNRWIKNNFRAIKALDELFSEHDIEKNVVVLGVGSIDFSKYVKNKSKFIFKGYVSDKELNSYFSNAFSFIYPTLNEGYGYPPIKAMEYNTPVLASAITSVTEVCKDAALYFNPLSINEIKTRILTLLNQSDVRDRIVLNGNRVVSDLKDSNESQLSDIVEYIFNKENL